MKASEHATEDQPADRPCGCGGREALPPRWREALQAFIARLSKRTATDSPGGDTLDAGAIDKLITRQDGKGRGLIELLQDVSEHFGYLPPEALRYISKTMDVPLTRLYSIATFYQDFKLTPQGKHRLVVCSGTACHVKGAAGIVDVLCRELQIQPGETTADGKLTLSTVNCIGLCGVGPVAIMDGEYHSQLTADKALGTIKAL